MRALRKASFLARRGPLPAVGWLVVLCALAGAWLRLDGLGEPGLWWDEVISLDKALLPLGELWSSLAAWATGDAGIELFPPLYHALLHAALAVSRSDEALRLVGVVFGVLAIPAMFFLGRELFGRGAGLAAAFLLATSTYHIHYSREVRPYTLFILLSLAALTALHAAVVRGKARAWLAYAPAMAALFYTSYMASTTLAAHGLFTLAFLAPRVRRPGPERTQALGVFAKACAAWAAALLVYLPWLPNQLVTLHALRDTPRTAALSWSFFATAADEFAGFAYTGPLPVGALFGLLVLAGGWTARKKGRASQMLLLGLWALMPVAGVAVAQTGIDVTSRYIVTAYLAGVLLAGQALWALGERLTRACPLPDFAREGAALTVALLAASLCAWPSLAYQDVYLRREPSRYKQAMAWLELHEGSADRVLFSSGRGLKLLARWYLGDTFQDLSAFIPKGYKRAFALVPQGRTRGFTGRTPLFSSREADIFAVGLASAGSAVLTPDPRGPAVFRADLGGVGFYRDCFLADNLAPDFGGATLSLMDAARPGQAVFACAAPRGMRLRSVRVEAVFTADFKADIASDARVELSAGPDGRVFHPLGAVTARDFQPTGQGSPAGHHVLTRVFTLPDDTAGADMVYVRADYGPVTRFGAVELAGLNVFADLVGPAPAPSALAAQVMENVAARNALVAWEPGLALAGRGQLFAFAHEGAAPSLGVGSPSALAGFTREHPGLAPVLTIPLDQTRTAYSLFDPGLERPLIDVGPGRPVRAAAGKALAREVRAARIHGLLDRPTLVLDGAATLLPLRADWPAELDLNFAGQARLRLTPLFDQAGAAAALPLGTRLKRPGNEDCLTCAGPGPCSLTLSAVSDWPVTALRLEYFPRVVADLAGRNQVAAKVSVDGGPFVALDRFRPPPSGRWEGLKSRRSAVLPLPKPARAVAVRFELSGEDAQLWSAPDARLNLELSLDAAASVSPGATGPRLTLDADQPLAVELLPAPIRFPDALSPRR